MIKSSSHPAAFVSVIMPVFNSEKFLKASITSIIKQSYINFELIIINDGSTDESEKIIKSFNDTRIVYLKNEKNLKIAKSLNIGISHAKGKYIARMDADDIAHLDRLRIQFNFMEANTDVDVCGSWITSFYENESPRLIKYPIQHEEIKIRLIFECPVAHPTVFAKRSFFEEKNYNENYIPAEDYKLWGDAIEKYKFHNIPIPLLAYRAHADQTSYQKQSIQARITESIKMEILERLDIKATKEEAAIHRGIFTPKLSLNREKTLFWITKIFNSYKKNNSFESIPLYSQFSRAAYQALRRGNLSYTRSLASMQTCYILGLLLWFLRYNSTFNRLIYSKYLKIENTNIIANK